MDDHKIAEEYLSLVDRSLQLFGGLRDLPQYGKQWQPYFQRTFEVYTKLWRFQQVHRAVLESKEQCNMKRWEIGEIASQIGQLYYHYYLRTGESNYLLESYVFYDAIRERQYFRNVLDAKSQQLMVKKLRYYARFIVVCLLLNKRQVVRDLAQELKQHIDDYVKIFKPVDTQEWCYIFQEMNQFFQADSSVDVRLGSSAAIVSNRLPRSEAFPSRIRLQEAILVGNTHSQVKFGELSLDLFRVMQVLEREPSSGGVSDGLSMGNRMSDSQESSDKAWTKKRSNPHKCLLYRPMLSQLLVFASTAFKELQDNNVLLLYISAEGFLPEPSVQASLPDGYRTGGVAVGARKSSAPAVVTGTSSARLSVTGSVITVLEEPLTEAECLYPSELLPFTRKNLFLIVESDNASAFAHLPNLFGKAVLSILAARSHPPSGPDVSQHGGLLSHFLFDPVTAFCLLVGTKSLDHELYRQARRIVQDFAVTAEGLLANHPETPVPFLIFLQEPYLREFIVRFMFYHVVTSVHQLFQSDRAAFTPTTQPALPPEILSNTQLANYVYQVAALLSVSGQLTDAPPPQVSLSVQSLADAAVPTDTTATSSAPSVSSVAPESTNTTTSTTASDVDGSSIAANDA